MARKGSEEEIKLGCS